jgi:hypothetical protein
MAFTYSEAVNGVYADPKDEVRFLLMDTVEQERSLSDQEIYYLLDFFDGSVYLAASQGALHLAIAYAQLSAVTAKSVGDLHISLSYQNTSAEYKILAAKLRLGRMDNHLKVYNGDSTDTTFTTGQFDDYRV